MTQLWISAIEVGSFYALIALGYYLILEGSGFFNFAAGGYAMVAGLGTAYFVRIHDWPAAVAILVGIILAVTLSIGTEIAIVRPVERRADAELPALIAVMASLFILQQGAGWLFGRRPLPGTKIVTIGPARIGDTVIRTDAIVLVAVALVIFVSVYLWLTHTSYGRMLRAVGDNQEAAHRLGFPVARIRIAAFAVAGLIFGIAGILISAKAGISNNSGLTFSLFGFLSFVLGGRGTFFGPILGGYLLASLHIFASYYLGGAFLDYSTLVLALVLFALRPEGLISQRVRT